MRKAEIAIVIADVYFNAAIDGDLAQMVDRINTMMNKDHVARYIDTFLELL